LQIFAHLKTKTTKQKQLNKNKYMSNFIVPSNEFDGAATQQTYVASPYIDQSARKMLFNKNSNPNGAYVLFLPAYKADSQGRGVWYKKFTVRDNFGKAFKDKYYVADRSKDPAEHFAFNYIQIHGVEKVKPYTEKTSSGRTFKKYPDFGRLSERVIFNVTYYSQTDLANQLPYILDLPHVNGASKLLDHLKSRQLDGSPRPPINHPHACIPVKVQLTDGANPWHVQVESAADACRLTPNLYDPSLLYNLDNILIQKSADEIISKLREMYPEDFDTCMEGFPGLTRNAVQGFRPERQQVIPANNVPANAAPQYTPQPQQMYNPPVQQYMPPQPAVNPPPQWQMQQVPDNQVNQAQHVPALNQIRPPTNPVNPPAAIDISALPANPMQSTQMSREEALRFINQD
jgi:hypothetical protein